MTIQFRCKDFLLKECEFEIKGAHSVDEMMKLVDVHWTEAHRTLKVSPETLEKIRPSMRGWPDSTQGPTVRGIVQIESNEETI